MFDRLPALAALTVAVGLCLTEVSVAQTTIMSPTANSTVTVNAQATTMTVRLKWGAQNNFEPDRVEIRDSKGTLVSGLGFAQGSDWYTISPTGVYSYIYTEFSMQFGKELTGLQVVAIESKYVTVPPNGRKKVENEIAVTGITIKKNP